MARWTNFVVLAIVISSAASAQMGPPGGGEGRQGRGGRGGEFGGSDRRGPRGEERSIEPVKRAKFDKAVTAMFREADANHDGVITVDELQGIIAARREALIRGRFQHVDRDANGSIDFAEFSAWQTEMGSVALSDEAALGGRTNRVPSVIQPPLGRDPADQLLARLIEPLGATVILEADANAKGSVTLAELLAYEGKRFDAADKDHDGAVSPQELRAWRGAEDAEGPTITPFGRRPAG